MLMHEVCKEVNVTKKALNYYVMKKLVNPTILPNGYREFSDDDVNQLKRIVLYRQLDMSISSIKSLMQLDEKTALESIYVEMKYEAYIQKKKRDCVMKMIHHQLDKDQINAVNMCSKDYVLDELKRAFPGGFGRSITSHFQVFEFELMDNPRRKRAFMDMISYLDQVELEVPLVLEKIYDEMDEETLLSINRQMKEYVHKPTGDLEAYKQIHQDMAKNIEDELPDLYLAMKSFNEALKALFHKEAYRLNVIDNMKILSKDYRVYHDKLNML